MALKDLHLGLRKMEIPTSFAFFKKDLLEWRGYPGSRRAPHDKCGARDQETTAPSASQTKTELRDLCEAEHSVNRLIDEMTTLMLAEFDAETRFQLRAERGRRKKARGNALLEKAKRGGK